MTLKTRFAKNYTKSAFFAERWANGLMVSRVTHFDFKPICISFNNRLHIGLFALLGGQHKC